MVIGSDTDLKADFNATEAEQDTIKCLAKHLRESEIPDNELLMNLPLYFRQQELSHILYINHLYQQVLDVHGSIFEFGSRWGRNLALFQHFRSIYENKNWTRKVVGFDTFSGFPSVTDADTGAKTGGFSVTPGWAEYLNKLFRLQELGNPVPQITKYQIVVGDVMETLPKYLEEHQETLISLAYLDFDLYEPTKFVLDIIPEYMNPGGVVAFDELNCEKWPGETKAYRESIMRFYKVRHVPFSPTQGYLIAK